MPKVSEVKNTSEVEGNGDILTFDEFIKEVKPNPGLIASFKLETSDLDPRTLDSWRAALESQSLKVYK